MSNYCEMLFGKSLYNITLDDLVEFFKEERDETNTLEFKAGDVQVEKLYQEICAFLNTQGGVLIVGSPKELKDKKGCCCGELTPSKFRGKDWLYQKISANIVPVPTHLKIQEIQLEHGFCFIIEVPQSINPPHQCNDNGTYYIRMERESKPAPHGIIEALFNRRLKPILIVVDNIEEIDEKHHKVTIQVSNESQISAEMVNFIVDIYGAKNIDNQSSNIDKFAHKIVIRNTKSADLLVKGLSLSNCFTVNYGKATLYMINVCAWCKDASLVRQITVINTKKPKIIVDISSEEMDESEFDKIRIKYQKIIYDLEKSYFDKAEYIKKLLVELINCRVELGTKFLLSKMTITEITNTNLVDENSRKIMLFKIIDTDYSKYLILFIYKDSDLIDYINRDEKGDFFVENKIIKFHHGNSAPQQRECLVVNHFSFCE